VIRSGLAVFYVSDFGFIAKHFAQSLYQANNHIG
jgi:hypothetical protein